MSDPSCVDKALFSQSHTLIYRESLDAMSKRSVVHHYRSSFIVVLCRLLCLSVNKLGSGLLSVGFTCWVGNPTENQEDMTSVLTSSSPCAVTTNVPCLFTFCCGVFGDASAAALSYVPSFHWLVSRLVFLSSALSSLSISASPFFFYLVVSFSPWFIFILCKM